MNVSSVEVVRAIIWESLPSSRHVIVDLELEAEVTGERLTSFVYIFEASIEILEPIIDGDDVVALKSFFDMCDNLLAVNNDYIEELVDGLIAKKVARRHRELIPLAGPLLRNLIDRWQF